jgi:hypothetical protein
MESRMKKKKKTIKPLSATKTSPDYNILLVVCVQMFNLPYALEIVFEILARGNSHVQMGHAHLAFLFNSQSVSRGHQVFNLKYGDQFASRTREGRTYLATIALLPYPVIESVLAVNWISLRRSCLFQKASPDFRPLL